MPGNRALLLYLIAGTIVRLAYGACCEPWSGQCDQLAWGMVLSSVRWSDGISYGQLIHYPHEGGTILLSALALITGAIGKMPALTVAALLFDLGSRCVQLLVVRRFFSPQVFHWFGAWTVLSIPGVLPWSVVNYGLHSLAAFVPFALLWLALREHTGSRGHLVDSLVLAAMVWFSYSTVVLAPLYLFFRRDLFRVPRNWLSFFGVLIAVLGLHVLVRSLADPGFHLSGFSPSTIRGMALDAPFGKFIRQADHLWTSAFPGSSMLPPMLGLPAALVRRLWALIMLAGFVGGGIAWYRRRPYERHLLFCMLAVLLFGLAYAASPFFQESANRTAFVHYRHWAFILPMTTLAAIAGLGTFRYSRAPLLGHALLCAVSVAALFTGDKANESTYKETGYVLSMKFGHDPRLLSAIAHHYPDAEPDLFRGAGWGSAEILLAFHEPGQRDVDTLAALTMKYAPRERPWFREGLALALSRDAMHGLPPDLRDQVRALIPTPDCER
jgi:hypothetical protein